MSFLRNRASAMDLGIGMISERYPLPYYRKSDWILLPAALSLLLLCCEHFL
jgi:hypothetical protein